MSNTAFIKQKVFRGKTLRQLVDHQTENNQLITPKEIGTWIKNQHPKLQWVHALKLERVFQDIQSARHSIILSLPNQVPLPKEWSDQLQNVSQNVKRTILSGNIQSSIQIDQWIKEEVSFPFVLIDQRYLWLGLPLEGMKRTQPPHVTVRLDSKVFAEQFLAQLPVGE